MNDVTAQLEALHILDPTPWRHGTGWGAATLALRGDLSGDYLRALRQNIAELAGNYDHVTFGPENTNYWSPLQGLFAVTPRAIWAWKQLEDEEVRAVLAHAPTSLTYNTYWMANWVRQNPLSDSDLAEIHEDDDPTLRVWKALPAPGPELSGERASEIENVISRNGQKLVDWPKLLELAAEAGDVEAVVVFTNTLAETSGTADLVNAPRLVGVYQQAAELIAAHHQALRADIMLRYDTNSAVEFFGPAIWGDETWNQYIHTSRKELGAPTADGSIPRERSCVNGAVAQNWAKLSRRDEADVRTGEARTYISAGSVDDVVEMMWRPLRTATSDAIWRLTHAGYSGDWLWKNVPLSRLGEAAPAWVAQRLKWAAEKSETGAATNPIWALLEDGWRSTGAALETLT